ncbi:protein of unknown function [Pararobbsia alpina]
MLQRAAAKAGALPLPLSETAWIDID